MPSKSDMFTVPSANKSSCELDARLCCDGNIEVGDLGHDRGVIISPDSARKFAEALLRMAKGHSTPQVYHAMSCDACYADGVCTCGGIAR